MQHEKHSALILEFETRVQAGPPKEGFLGSYFQGCWALVKRIGPAFKVTDYRNQQDRDQAWRRFDKALGKMKQQQAKWEASSAELETQVTTLISQAYPPADVCALAPELRQAALLASSEAQKKALESFMALREQLGHEQYKRLSAKLRNLKKALRLAWDSFKADHPRHRAAKEASTRRKRAELLDEQDREQLRNDLALLDTKIQASQRFERLLAESKDPSEKAKLTRWISDTKEIIAELRKQIDKLEQRVGRDGAD